MLPVGLRIVQINQRFNQLDFVVADVSLMVGGIIAGSRIHGGQTRGRIKGIRIAEQKRDRAEVRGFAVASPRYGNRIFLTQKHFRTGEAVGILNSLAFFQKRNRGLVAVGVDLVNGADCKALCRSFNSTAVHAVNANARVDAGSIRRRVRSRRYR